MGRQTWGNMDLQSPPQFFMESLDYCRPYFLLGKKENATSTARTQTHFGNGGIHDVHGDYSCSHFCLSSRSGSARWNDGGSPCGHVALDHETLLAWRRRQTKLRNLNLCVLSPLSNSVQGPNRIVQTRRKSDPQTIGNQQ